MRTTRKIGVVTALLVSTAFTSQAQTSTTGGTPAATASNKEFRLSVGPEFGLPLGDFNTAYNWTFGGSVQADIPIVPNFYVTVNAGYDDAFVRTSETSGRNLQLIPLKAGLKYFFVDNLVYVQGQAGATILGNKTDAGADKSAAFVYTPQVGVLIKLAPKNYLDAGVYFQQTQSFWNAGSGNLNQLGIRLAYTLGM
ncbi:MAG TPA: hypothetical protein VG605_08215 [Puia sp.]|nr:hypothetical protein [Puia sp.]